MSITLLLLHWRFIWKTIKGNSLFSHLLLKMDSDWWYIFLSTFLQSVLQPQQFRATSPKDNNSDEILWPLCCWWLCPHPLLHWTPKVLHLETWHQWRMGKEKKRGSSGGISWCVWRKQLGKNPYSQPHPRWSFSPSHAPEWSSRSYLIWRLENIQWGYPWVLQGCLQGQRTFR